MISDINGRLEYEFCLSVPFNWMVDDKYKRKLYKHPKKIIPRLLQTVFYYTSKIVFDLGIKTENNNQKDMSLLLWELHETLCLIHPVCELYDGDIYPSLH